MILKYSLLALLATIFITASDPYFGFQLGKRASPAKSEDDVVELPLLSLKSIDPYLKDYDNRVSDTFGIGGFYYSNVRFWFLIYTTLDSSQVAIHDKGNLSLIYKVLDFSALREKNLSANTLYILQQKLSSERVRDLKKTLRNLVKNPFSIDREARDILRSLRSGGLDLPDEKQARIALFKRLIENIRSQTGQRDYIHAGLRRALPYQKFLQQYFKDRNLPAELLSIPFLESSFNPKAHSRVSALGIWQFMPLIASYYLPKRSPHLDYRSNVGVSSIAAATLLHENHRIMKKWDLTVTSYNSGTKHLLKSRRRLASHNVDLEDIIRHSSSSKFGFASKNFYSEFLALAHVLAYKNEIFPGIASGARDDVDNDLVFSLLKCTSRIDKFIDSDLLDEVAYYNDHIRDFKKTYPKGTILTSKSRLPSGKFLKLNENLLFKRKPKDWALLVRNQSCSTR